MRAGAAQRPDSIARSIDRVFDNVRNTDGPGCAVGVSRGGKPVFEQGYGMANLETGTPIRPTSIFHVASVSKQFTAAAILLLERDRKLSLDDDIRKYLPEIPDYGTPITIRHLLTHSSGLRDELELIYFARGRFEEDRITEADVMDLITRQTALNFKPGSEWLYSNTGYTLLGLIVKRATENPSASSRRNESFGRSAYRAPISRRLHDGRPRPYLGIRVVPALTAGASPCRRTTSMDLEICTPRWAIS